jgi:tRNA(Ile)-lysidine synthase
MSGDGPAAASGAAAGAAGALPAGLSREALVAVVRAALDEEVPHAATVLLAVSGGPDSTALAYLVAEARPDLRAAVAHVRHGLRDDTRDAAVAARHAGALGFPYHERAVTVRPQGEGPEAAARRARYQALAALARHTRARWVLVGHTADDQAETLLLNLARGTGVRGLAGMAPARTLTRAVGAARLVRPLLRVRRADLRAFVAGEGLAAVADPTNHDPGQRRARARHDVLPALASLSGGPGDPVSVLTRLADLARDDATALDALAAEHARRLIVAWGPVRAVRIDQLEVLPRAVAARVVQRLLTRVRGHHEGLTADAVRATLALRAGQGLHVPGGAWVTAGAGWLAAVPADVGELPHRPLPVPGAVDLPELRLRLHADLAPEDPDGQRRLEVAWRCPAPPPGPFGRLPPRSALPAGAAREPWAVVPAALTGGLVVRARHPGDRIRLPAGRRKLQDLFIDLGIPRAARGLVPVVADAAGEPIWIPGLALRHVTDLAGPPARLWLAPIRPASSA